MVGNAEVGSRVANLKFLTDGLPVTRSERAVYLLKTHPDTVRARRRLKPRVRNASATMANTITFAPASVHRSPCVPNL